ncbi:hypothetical protein Patl1_32361 [Pistacia atlantica]|uniref:Uncharacterized protein n=1 Tax=Pistacia atlantica TaxID=434234 RepID=A0ACC1ALL2_9ROSI|nr:hypothetical protein Patl1_32361 [Pistacia atlantica]
MVVLRISWHKQIIYNRGRQKSILSMSVRPPLKYAIARMICVFYK